MDLKLRLAMQAFRKDENPETAMRLAKAFMRASDSVERLEISGMLTVSTSHVDESDAELLGAISSFAYEYGWLISTFDLIRVEKLIKENNPNIYNLMLLAKENNCSWLRLDADGPVLEELPTYDW